MSEKKKSNPYEEQEPEAQYAREPAVAYRRKVDINAMKLRLMEDVMRIDDVEKLTKLDDFLDDLCVLPGTPPCQYTLEELRERIRLGVEDIKNGKYDDAEEVLKEWDKW